MSSADVSAIVDLISAPDATPTPEPPPTPDLPEVDPTSPDPGAEPASEPAEPAAEPDAESVEPPIDGRTNPAAVRSALKALRDSDPKNAPIARQLNDSFGRWEAAKQVFPGGVNEMREVKSFIDANGGIEGLTSLHETIQSVNETDGLLYAGDPRVLDSIIEDMRKEGKLDAFSKLASPFLEKLRGIDEKGYWNALKPHVYHGLVDTGVTGAFEDLVKVLTGDTPDIKAAQGLAFELRKWSNALRDTIEREDKAKLDPDRQAFEAERNEFQTAKQKEFQTSVASDADSYNNRTLGEALKPYVKLPFFKNLTSNRNSMLSLAREIKSSLMEELSADKTYKAQMDAFFSQKTPDKGKISQYHQSKVDTVAKRIVKQVIETRYPDYAKRSAPARPGASGAKPAVAATPAAPNQPEYVKAKPEWNSIDWSKDPGKMLFITGKAHLTNGKFVYWGKQKK